MRHFAGAWNVRIEEYHLLQGACLALLEEGKDGRVDGVSFVNDESDAIAEELGGFFGTILDDREQLRDEAPTILQPWLFAYDLCLLQFCDMAHFAMRIRNTRTGVLWPDHAVAEPPTRGRVFYLLASNASQMALAARSLLVSGFEGQSRGLLRTFVEVLDMMLAVVADRDFYGHYVTVHDDERDQYRHWSGYLRPSVVRGRLADLDVERRLSDRTPIPANDVREDTYRWFSRFSHVDRVAHLVSAYPPEIETEQMGPVAMLGYLGAMTRSTFQRLLLYLWLFFQHFDDLVEDVHRWRRFNGRYTSRDRYFTRGAVFDALFRKNYEVLHMGVMPVGDERNGA